jgi:hypothetical protein
MYVYGYGICGYGSGGVHAGMLGLNWIVCLPFFPIGEVVQLVLPAVAPEWAGKVASLAGHLGRPSFLHI